MKKNIEITLVWDDAQSFKRHVADMNHFRKQHKDFRMNEMDMLKDMPRSDNIQPVNPCGGSKILISSKRKSTLVPIWEIDLPGSIQN